MQAFTLTAKKGPKGRKLFQFVQFHGSLAEAWERGGRLLAEQGLTLVRVA